MTWNLAETIQSVMDDYDTTDPMELAEFVVGRVPDYERDLAFRIAMATYVRSYISRRRGSADAPPPRESTKVTGVREAWESWLNEPISVGPNHYRRRGEMTADDCRYAATLRRSIAEANLVEAAKWDEWAERIDAAGASCLRDASTPTLAGV